jgi:uncharacterized protein (DUF4415 family)
MNENAMNSTSETNWDKVDALTAAAIDTSDIPLLTDEFFENSRWWPPKELLSVLVKVDPGTISWFQAQGEDYEQKMAAALRIYAEAHKEQSNSEQVPAA